jgi:hypothetical protein
MSAHCAPITSISGFPSISSLKRIHLYLSIVWAALVCVPAVFDKASAGIPPALGQPTLYDAWTYFLDDFSPVVLSRGTDGHIYFLPYSGDVSVTGLAGAPTASGTPSGFGSWGDGDWVIYRGSDSHVHRLYQKPYLDYVYNIIRQGDTWEWEDLTASSGAPTAAGNPSGYRRPDGVDSVFYRGSDNHIYEIYQVYDSLYHYYPTPPGFGNLTSLTGAPKADGDPSAYTRSDGIFSVVYRGQTSRTLDGHVYELYLDGGWSVGDLTALTGAPGATGNPSGYQRSDSVDSVVYRGTNGHIYELYLKRVGREKSWRFGDLTEQTGAPTASGSPVGYVRSDGINSVVYRGYDGHINEIYLSDGAWNYVDITAAAGAPNAASSPDGFEGLEDIGVNRVVYRGSDNNVYELYLYGGEWSFENLTQ